MNIITSFSTFLLITSGLLIGITSPSITNFNMNNETKTKMQPQEKYGIAGLEAPELTKDIEWIDSNGDSRDAIQLSDYEGKFKVIYCFQSWCPGCHSRGLPALQKMTTALKDNDNVVFLAIQTVFEGAHTNTKDKLLKTQKQYNLSIQYKPWRSTCSVIIHGARSVIGCFITYIVTESVDQKGKVVFNDFHLDETKAIEYLKAIE